MAVYTQVDDAQLRAFLADYELGVPTAFKGIAEGVENSNYYLETDQGRYILTLFEKRADPADLPYFIALKQHLARKHYPCPAPIAARDGQALRELAGRPAVIVSFLDGLSPKRPNKAQCRALGAGLARMHTALDDFEMERPNTLGFEGWVQLWEGRAASADQLSAGLADQIATDVEDLSKASQSWSDLPRGPIHADLFSDNAFFLGDRFSGAIDFYFACTDARAYDLAVCLNAWAFDDAMSSSGLQYNYSHGAALIAGYQTERPLSEAELAALPSLAKGAAMRFFLTRLVDWTDTPADALVRPKDPMEYAARLRFHRKAVSATDYGA